MLIKLDELEIYNFGIFRGKTSLDFRGKNIIGVLAEYDNDEMRSNRAGKCFGKNTQVRMFDGSVKMVQNIEQGEYVMGPDSKRRKVSGVTSGAEEMYHITSTDGSISFECNASHILSVKSSCSIIINGVKYSKTDVININVTDYLALSNYKKSMLHLFRSGGIEYKKNKLELEPYLYGVFLGDGDRYNGSITNGDVEIKNYVESYAKRTKGLTLKTVESEGKTKKVFKMSLTGKTQGQRGSLGSTSPYIQFLKRKCLINKQGSAERFIADEYLKSSIADRLEILAGIIDTEGHLAKNRYYEVTAKSVRLASDIVELCRSVGLATSLRTKTGTINGKVVGEYQRVNIYGDISKIPCKVLRKKTDFKTTKRDVLRKNFSVKPIGVGEYYGFAVDKDNLFLLSDYTVVHNSLILESIKYNLVGTTRAKREVNMIHTGMDYMYVKCTYSDSKGKIYTIKRGRNLKGGGMLELDWIEKTRESQQAISDIFGVNASDFELTHFFKQSDINGFMNLSPAEKTKYLMTWFDNDHWEVINKKIKDDLKDYKVKLKENEAVRKSIETASTIPDEINIEISLCEKLAEKLHKSEIKNEKELEEFTQEYNDIDKESSVLKQKEKDLVRKMSVTKSNEAKAKRIKSTISSIESDLKGVVSELGDKCFKGLREHDLIINEISDTKGNVRALKAELQALKNAKGICPVSKLSCDIITLDAKKSKEIEKSISYNNDVLKCLNDEKAVIDRLAELSCEKSDLETELKMEKSALKEFKNDANYKELSAEIDEIHNQLEVNDVDIAEIKETIVDLKSVRNSVRADLNKTNRKMATLEQQLRSAKEDEEKIIDLETKNRKLRLVIEDLNYLSLATGKGGIPSEEIENAFGEIQDDINYLMKEVDIDATVSFSPDKELTSWEEFCHCGFKFPKGFRNTDCPDCGELRSKKRKDEISLKIIENGIESDFDLDSGGGKTIISFCVRVALTMLKKRQNKSKLNMIFLDEVDSALDKHFWSSVIDVITRILTRVLGYDQILMISHKDEIKNAIPNIIKVVRYSDYSKANFL